jgi:hypothetical protein
MNGAMNDHCRWATGLMVVLCAALLAMPAWSQEAKKAGAAAKKAPAVQPPTAEAENAGAEKAAAAESPAVRAVLITHPSTPAECVRAAKVLFDLKRPALSKTFLQKVLEAKPDPQQLADLLQQFGSAMFLNMAEQAELLPEAQQLADAVLAASKQHHEDPQRLLQLIGQLQDPSEEVRLKAIRGLQAARSTAVGPLVNVLADAGHADAQPAVCAALVSLGDDAIGPLLALVEQPDATLAAHAIRVLGQIKSARAVLYLLAPAKSPASSPEIRAAAVAALNRLLGQVPTDRQAAGMLTERAKLYVERRYPLENESDGHVELWQWDAAKKQCAAKNYSRDDAFRLLAARLARDAFALAPDDQAVRLLYLTTLFEQVAYENGLDKPLEGDASSAVSAAAKLGVATIDAVLQAAMAGGHPAAAMVAAHVLGRSGKTEEVLYRGPGPTPLVLALQSPDRRLRMAAAEAIVRLHPGRPFAGSSYVPQTLAFFAATTGKRRALVISSNVQNSRELVGMMGAAGLEMETASTGRDAVRLAIASPDYEVVLIDSALGLSIIDPVVQQLRRDWRSADLRVGILARSEHFADAARLAARYPLTLSFARPRDEQAFRWQLAQLAALAPREFVGQAERQQQAVEAIGLLSQLSAAPGSVYDLRRVQDSALAALYVPGLNLKAIAALGNLGSAESQRALVEMASRPTQSLEARQAAAEAFRLHTQKFGVLLSAAEIRGQYDRYNQSESLDKPTQRVLGEILDCIEASTQTGKKKPAP